MKDFQGLRDASTNEKNIQIFCAAHIGMDGIRIEKEPRQETNM